MTEETSDEAIKWYQVTAILRGTTQEKTTGLISNSLQDAVAQFSAMYPDYEIYQIRQIAHDVTSQPVETATAVETISEESAAQMKSRLSRNALDVEEEPPLKGREWREWREWVTEQIEKLHYQDVKEGEKREWVQRDLTSFAGQFDRLREEVIILQAIPFQSEPKKDLADANQTPVEDFKGQIRGLRDRVKALEVKAGPTVETPRLKRGRDRGSRMIYLAFALLTSALAYPAIHLHSAAFAYTMGVGTGTFLAWGIRDLRA